MVEGIKINLDEVTQIAASIRSLNASMNSTLENIKKEMNHSSNYYQSKDGDEIRNRFNTMSASFEEYRKVVESYAQFLDDTVATYDGIVNTNTANAENF